MRNTDKFRGCLIGGAGYTFDSFEVTKTGVITMNQITTFRDTYRFLRDTHRFLSNFYQHPFTDN